MLAHFLHAVQRLVNLPVSFKKERNGDNTYGEDIHIFGCLGNDRSRTGSGTSSHSGSDKYHFTAVVQHSFYVFYTFFGCFTCTLRAVSGS